MAESSQPSFGETVCKPLVEDNPIVNMMLGLCSCMAVTTNLRNGVAMGVAVIFVLVSCNWMVSAFRRFIPSDIRIPVYVVMIAASVTVVDLCMAAYAPAAHREMGIFLALIVVNCIILARAEAFAARNDVVPSIADGLGCGIGYSMVLCFLGVTREIIGGSALWGIPLTEWAGMVGLKETFESLANTMSYEPSILFILPPGAFLLIGLLMAFMKALKRKRAGEAVA